MPIGWNNIKRDFARHRRKAMMLGVLTLIMTGLMVKAYFEINPESASAAPLAGPQANGSQSDSSSEADTDTRISQSRELWRVLRETKGIKPDETFKLVTTLYQVDPSRRMAAPNPGTTAHTPQTDTDTVERQREIEIRDRAKRDLTVRTTIMGNANSRPQAIVNQEVLMVGDTIKGFTITAIRARAVEFTLDGVTTVITMNNDPHGP